MKAIAIETRTAETPESGSVHESAGRRHRQAIDIITTPHNQGRG